MERRATRQPSAASRKKAPPQPRKDAALIQTRVQPVLLKGLRRRAEAHGETVACFVRKLLIREASGASHGASRSPGVAASAPATEALSRSAASLAALTGLVRKGGLAHATEGWVLESLLALGHVLVDRRKKTELMAERLATALFGDRLDGYDDEEEDDADPGDMEGMRLVDPDKVIGAADIRVALHSMCDGFAAAIQSSADPTIHREAVVEISRVRAVVGPVKDPQPKKAH